MRMSRLANRCMLASISVIAACSEADYDSNRVVVAGGQNALLQTKPAYEYGEAVADLGSGMVSRFESSTVRAMNRADLTALRPDTTDANPSAWSTATEHVLQDAAARSAGEEMTVAIGLDDPAFDFSRLATDDDDARAALVEQRKEALRPLQDAVEVQIQALGGKVLNRFWLANVLLVRVPAEILPDVLALPSVKEASPAESKKTPGLAYTGSVFRSRTRASNLLASAFDGSTFGRSSTPTPNVKIGIDEVGQLNTRHVGWFTPSGSSRVRAYYRCTSSGCTLPPIPVPAASDVHGTQVAWAAAGSIEAGQDPNFPGVGTTSQIQRSGIARGAHVYYFEAPDACGDASALQQAVSSGVDVFNMSFGDSCGTFAPCNRAFDCCGMNAQMRAALDAGVLLAACGGNCSSGTTCNLWYPGFRPETIGVVALDSDDSVSYENTPVSSGECHGPVSIGLIDSRNVNTPGLEMSAPGLVRGYFGMGVNNYDISNSIFGCSFATPIVSGAAALLRHSFNSLGWSGNNARALMVNMMLMGDASDGTAAGSSMATVSSRSGYGRLRLHWPSGTDLTAPWGWGWRNFVIQQGQEVRWTVGDAAAESSSITGWKWAFLWFENDLNAVSDIIIDVLNTCPPGGGEVIVLSDLSFALRKRIRLNQTQIGGKCLVMRARALQTPSQGTRVWSADYFFGGSNIVH